MITRRGWEKTLLDVSNETFNMGGWSRPERKTMSWIDEAGLYAGVFETLEDCIESECAEA